MAKPQQPELARSGRGATDPASAKATAGSAMPSDSAAGPVPEANRPGHHPPAEQDKPTRPPLPRARTAKEKVEPNADPARFDFEFDAAFERVDRLLGIRADNSYVEIAGDRVTVQFGPWRVQTNTANVIAAEGTGPYNWWKVVGAPHLSLAHRGLTTATTTTKG